MSAFSRSAPLPSASSMQTYARRRSMQARGDTELLIYERIAPVYSDEDSDGEEMDWQGSSQDYHGGGEGAADHPISDSESEGDQDMDDAADMSMDEDEPRLQPTPSADEPRFKAPAIPKRKLDKGKGRAVPPTTTPMSVTAPAVSELERQKERERQAKERERTRAERRASLSSRRPVIVLRKDSGWCFSHDAFMPAYQRERYTTSTLLSSSTASSSNGSQPTIYDEEEDIQPACVDIYVSQEDSRRILPSLS